MEWWHYFLLAGLGVVAGTLNVLAGGGSLLTLPAMVFLGLDGAVANGTNRVAILAQNVTAVGGFRSLGFSDMKLSFSLALAALPGGICGALLGTMVRGELFNKVLGGVLIGVLLLMAVQQWRKRESGRAEPGETPKSAGPGPSRRQLVLGHLAMVAVGFYGGFIQAGVGFLLMAALHRVLGLDLVRVNMHKVFIVAVFTLAALIIFASRGQVLWIPGLALAVGNSLGGWIGSQLSVLKGENWIRTTLYVALFFMALKLLWPG
ncbi:MAG: sulfite exporter TauE/SafE family protein [Verrucomicrobiales bacterium]|nr:sulfite exporter TauE/SafE family protein [Verrucomicrobiales bacterium]